ncbi:MAG: helix-turn-helix domain-containing protein [Gammaproteobacteria bacterium]|nr:helix-turn-helix domain-containing protein [Gammaproteobacteria bacterium]
MNKRDISRVFRARLLETIERSQLSRAQLAESAGVDRSTLTQLLTGEGARLPRADTVAAVASVLQVSVDWLLGLSGEERLGAVVLKESLQITPRARSPVDKDLARWHEEAAGYKIRYVPSTLPDLLKIEAIMRHEYRDYTVRSADQAIAASHDRLAYASLPETDMEVCLSRQTLEVFARGEGIWSGLDRQVRRKQLLHMGEVLYAQYPSLRLYLFDGLENYSVPYTVFGPLRAAIFMGQMYFVFNTTEHIRALTRHFDDLIKAAVVQASDASRLMGELCEQELPA